MTYEELLLNEVSKWDINKATITYTHPLIFICGGSLDTKSAHTDNKNIFESLRKYLIDYAPIHNSSFNFRTAEDFQDYLTTYDDLLEFESDIAKICDLILIILESPGSLTELGIFLSYDEYRKKLVVVRNKEHTFESSFINLGPLLALKTLKDTSVLDYDWPYHGGFTTLNEQTFKFICDDINEHLKSPSTSTKLNPNDFSHIILCIYEIVRLFYPISEHEIHNIIQLLFNIQETNRNRIKKICYLLYKLDLLEKESVSSKTYYYPTNHKISKVKFSYSQKERFEFLKIRLAVKEFLDTLADTKRLHVLNVIQGQ